MSLDIVGLRARALLLLALAQVVVVGGCGGGSSSDSTPTTTGTLQTRVVASRLTGTPYPVTIHVPASQAGVPTPMPVIVALDGDSWFQTLVGIVESRRLRAIIVAVGNAGQRNRDFVPANGCTSDGGGEAAFLGFLLQELLPSIESAYGTDPSQRVLFGHSHGGSFALFAMFAQAPGQHSFKTYLSVDASVGCMPHVAAGWEQAYAAQHRALPVRLQLAYATQGNLPANVDYAQRLTSRGYQDFSFRSDAYVGTHGGIVPQALADGLAFALTGPR